VSRNSTTEGRKSVVTDDIMWPNGLVVDPQGTVVSGLTTVCVKPVAHGENNTEIKQNYRTVRASFQPTVDTFVLFQFHNYGCADT